MSLEKHIEKVLFSDEVIAERVRQLGAEITSDFSGDSESPVFVGVATGACLFLADLVRRIDLPIAIDFIRAESYGSGTVSNGTPKISFDLKLDITNKHVILVEDIVETGNTLNCLIEHLKLKKASSVSVCTLLDKPSRRKVFFKLVGNGKFYSGFEVSKGREFLAGGTTCPPASYNITPEKSGSWHFPPMRMFFCHNGPRL